MVTQLRKGEGGERDREREEKRVCVWGEEMGCQTPRWGRGCIPSEGQLLITPLASNTEAGLRCPRQGQRRHRAVVSPHPALTP